LEQLQKQAKDLLRWLRAGQPAATLAEAQFALAREYGFDTWASLKHHVEALARPETGSPASGEQRCRPLRYRCQAAGIRIDAAHSITHLLHDSVGRERGADAKGHAADVRRRAPVRGKVRPSDRGPLI